MWCPSALSPNHWHIKKTLLDWDNSLLTTHNSALPSLPNTELHLLKSVDIVANLGWGAAGNRRGRRGGRQISTSGIKHNINFTNINLRYSTQISTIQISAQGLKYPIIRYQISTPGINYPIMSWYEGFHHTQVWSLSWLVSHSATNAFWFCSRFWSWNHATSTKVMQPSKSHATSSCVTPQWIV